jgi:hypothetical protein
MPNGLLILAAFALYGLFVYGPELARLIGRKRKIIGKPYKLIYSARRCGKSKLVAYMDECDTLREVNARRGH